jgi:hypothetical protein
MSSRRQKRIRTEAVELSEDAVTYEVHAKPATDTTGPVDLLIRVEEATGVPSPTAGVTADLYIQLDIGSKRAAGHPTHIVGTQEATSCGGLFHEDYVVRRANASDQLLITLRSSALGNSCFGKVLIDIDKDLAGDRTGAPGETLVMKWFSLVPYFKSNDASITYDMQVRVVAKIIAPKQVHPSPSVTAMRNQELYILTDPKGTLPGVPIDALLFLQRSAAADKIAKGSLLLDTIGEARVLIDGKIGKRRSFFSSGEASNLIFPGVAAAMDAEAGLLERAAQELLQKVASGSGASNGAASPKPSITDLSRAPRASQRASLLFRGGPKVTEFDELSKTFAWKIQLPVPNVVEGATLPPSGAYSSDNIDIFGELAKTTDVAFGIRHAVIARCGLMMPFQTPFTVHGLGLRNTAPVVISQSNISLEALLVVDISDPEKPVRTLEVNVKSGKGIFDIVTITVFGSILLGTNGNSGSEWKALECGFNAEQVTKFRKVLTTSYFGLPSTNKNFTTSYYIELSVHSKDGTLKLPKTQLPVRQILPEQLEAVDQAKIAGTELDTLHMRSYNLETPIIAIPPTYPDDVVTLYNEAGEPLTFAEVVGTQATGGSRAGRTQKKANADVSSSLDPIEAAEDTQEEAEPVKRKSKKTEPLAGDGATTGKRKSKKADPVVELAAQ